MWIRIMIVFTVVYFSCEKQPSRSDLKNYLQGEWGVSYTVYSDIPADTIWDNKTFLYIFKCDTLITGSADKINIKEKIPYHVKKSKVVYKSDKIHYSYDGKLGPPLKINIISPSKCEWIAREGDLAITTGLERTKENE